MPRKTSAALAILLLFGAVQARAEQQQDGERG